MTLNTKYPRTSLNATLFLVIFISLFFNPISAEALENGEANLPSFTKFSKSVQNNEANVLRGVYIPGVLAFPVVQQSSGNAAYVSFTDGELTQFNMASQFGNVGLLAHNNLS